MKETEFGGADTDKTLGIQPAPHQLEASEQLRVMYASDPLDPLPSNIVLGSE